MRVPSRAATTTTYEAALAAGGREPIESTFEPDGYVREPSGDAYRHGGIAGRAGFYAHALDGGGVPLRLCGLIDDGVRTVIE